MIKNLVITLATLMAFSSFAQAEITALDDSQLSAVVAQGSGEQIMAALGGFKTDIQTIVSEQGEVSAEEFIGRLAAISSDFGIHLKGVNIDGVSYGDFHLTVKNGDQVTHAELPSHFDSITIDAVTLGNNDKSIGSIEFVNLNIQGNMVIEFK